MEQTTTKTTKKKQAAAELQPEPTLLDTLRATAAAAAAEHDRLAQIAAERTREHTAAEEAFRTTPSDETAVRVQVARQVAANALDAAAVARAESIEAAGKLANEEGRIELAALLPRLRRSPSVKPVLEAFVVAQRGLREALEEMMAELRRYNAAAARATHLRHLGDGEEWHPVQLGTMLELVRAQLPEALGIKHPGYESHKVATLGVSEHATQRLVFQARINIPESE